MGAGGVGRGGQVEGKGPRFTCFNGTLDSIRGVHLALPGQCEVRNGFRARATSPTHDHIGEALVLVGACPMTPRQHLHALPTHLRPM